jgi:hypothetical protein
MAGKMLPTTPIIDALEKPSEKGLVEPPMYFKRWLPFKRDVKSPQPSSAPKPSSAPQPSSASKVKLPDSCQGMQRDTEGSDLFFYLMDFTASIIAIFMASMTLYRQRTVLNGVLLLVAVFLRYIYLAFRVFTFLL